MSTLFGIFSGFLALTIVFGMLYCLCGPIDTYKPMPFEEEVNWLMKDHGLTRKEAERIADL